VIASSDRKQLLSPDDDGRTASCQCCSSSRVIRTGEWQLAAVCAWRHIPTICCPQPHQSPIPLYSCANNERHRLYSLNTSVVPAYSIPLAPQTVTMNCMPAGWPMVRLYVVVPLGMEGIQTWGSVMLDGNGEGVSGSWRKLSRGFLPWPAAEIVVQRQRERSRCPESQRSSPDHHCSSRSCPAATPFDHFPPRQDQLTLYPCDTKVVCIDVSRVISSATPRSRPRTGVRRR